MAPVGSSSTLHSWPLPSFSAQLNFPPTEVTVAARAHGSCQCGSNAKSICVLEMRLHTSFCSLFWKLVWGVKRRGAAAALLCALSVEARMSARRKHLCFCAVPAPVWCFHFPASPANRPKTAEEQQGSMNKAHSLSVTKPVFQGASPARSLPRWLQP